MAESKGLPGFTKLSELVYVRPGTKSDNAATKSTDPTTILIYAWGDALPKHLHKYILGYLLLYPSAQIILIMGPMLRLFYQTPEQRSQRMEVVLGALAGADERVLVHAMSNTGGMNYASTLHAYSSLNPEKALPHVLSIFDSTPGSPLLRSNIGPWSRAMAIGAASWFPGPLVIPQFISALFLLVSHGILWLRGIPSPAVFSCKIINDPEFESVKTPRIHLYGTGDDIIPWEAVEDHAASAKQIGYQVDLERFENSPHVGHMRTDPEKYWSAVKEAWLNAVEKQ
ncbi:hypothetical protein PFICI_09916 [Pestalotiopsis fici W106-1]|uniref:Uncharacterized protein n=1 Tax=Pestalotiopsis fici (strain W106-1 / CGMCC3.15140) TaxID=1229662 RepID=W3WVL1_PESFW|nr:uncharacterized protein PFICI_09916 [Pestalotiopsis fici W106-1]ETS77854.1 hypothetical protein PFICI_09916 [Pestalotiopsis fici W106-1]